MALEVMVNRVLVFLLNSALSGLWVLWEATSARVKSELPSAAAGVLIIMITATKRNTEANQRRSLHGWTGTDGLDSGELREKVEV